MLLYVRKSSRAKEARFLEQTPIAPERNPTSRRYPEPEGNSFTGAWGKLGHGSHSKSTLASAQGCAPGLRDSQCSTAVARHWRVLKANANSWVRVPGVFATLRHRLDFALSLR